MGINWGALGEVALVSFAAAVVVVALVSFALVGLSARTAPPSSGADTLPARLGPGAGTAIAVVCLAAAAAIVVYGIVLIAA